MAAISLCSSAVLTSCSQKQESSSQPTTVAETTIEPTTVEETTEEQTEEQTYIVDPEQRGYGIRMGDDGKYVID